MASYPFDDQFKTTVSNLPEWGNAWDILIYYWPQKQLSDDLLAAGYPIDVVEAHLKALLALPVDDLVQLALADQLEDSPALLVLQCSTSRDVLAKASALCESSVANERALGVVVLMRKVGQTYREEAVQAVTRLAAIERDDAVIGDLAYALCHLEVDNRLSFLQRAAGCSDPATRTAAAYSLSDLSDDEAIACKIALSRDPVDNVRNWATFGLYLGLEGDQYKRQDVRDALYERVNDPHEETHYEALEGLARCKDSRVIEPLIAALESEAVWLMAIDSAKEMADPALYPSLIALKECWTDSNDIDSLDRAIASCAPPSRSM
ncbi:MAG: HEAT repeat domain-containing protein [Cyanobacteria bacterium SZAS LIN-3]|nr:HEAT repeat domain-containing protein [Cyanobacteria bacterium SZAS LIN-3]